MTLEARSTRIAGINQTMPHQFCQHKAVRTMLVGVFCLFVFVFAEYGTKIYLCVLNMEQLLVYLYSKIEIREFICS